MQAKHPSSTMMDSFVQKLIRQVNREETRKQIQVYLLDPLVNHIMERVFPQLILTSVLFVLLLVVVMLTFGIILYHLRSGTGSGFLEGTGISGTPGI